MNAGAAPQTGTGYGPGWGPTATGNDVFALSVLTKPVSSTTTFVAKTYVPTTPPITNVGGSALFFPFPGSPNQSLQVAEVNYHDAFTAVGGCMLGASTISSLTSTSEFPSPNVYGGASGPATFTFVPNNPGICSQVISDSYATTTSLPVQVAGPLVVTPTTLALSLHSSPIGSYPGNAATVQGTKTWSYTPLVLTVSGCPIVSAAQTETDAPTFTAAPAGGIVTFTATATGSCTATVTDQFGESRTVSIVVYDDAVYGLAESPGTGSLTRGTSMGLEATATLNALPAGHSYYPTTASSIPVGITNVSYTGGAGGCTTSPGGWQTSGFIFTVTDSDPIGGVCSIIFGANAAASNNPYTTVAPSSVTARISFGAQAVTQVSVCNVVGNANYYTGSYAVNYGANPPTQAVGSNLAPPCAAIPATNVYVCSITGDSNYGNPAVPGSYNAATNTTYVGSTASPPCAPKVLAEQIDINACAPHGLQSCYYSSGEFITIYTDGFFGYNDNAELQSATSACTLSQLQYNNAAAREGEEQFSNPFPSNPIYTARVLNQSAMLGDILTAEEDANSVSAIHEGTISYVDEYCPGLSFP
jgi:hypothetical protein